MSSVLAPELTAHPLENGTSILKKMSSIKKKVFYLKKTGRNTAQNYNFLSAEDVFEAISAEMDNHGVVWMPSATADYTEQRRVNSQGKERLENLSTVSLSYRFFCTETGEYTSVMTMPGAGVDGGDKGPYKAITGAKKYALTTTFLIATGDSDPEVETPAEREEANLRKQPPPQNSNIGKTIQPEPPKPTPAANNKPATAGNELRPNTKPLPEGLKPASQIAEPTAKTQAPMPPEDDLRQDMAEDVRPPNTVEYQDWATGVKDFAKANTLEPKTVGSYILSKLQAEGFKGTALKDAPLKKLTGYAKILLVEANIQNIKTFVGAKK